MKITIRILVAVLILAASLFVTGSLIHWLKAEPLRTSLSLESTEWQQFPFRLFSSDEYGIEVRFRNALPDSTMESLLGDVRGEKRDVLTMEWEVQRGRELVASGFSQDHPFSPIYSGEWTGLLIGGFPGSFGRLHTLRIRTRTGVPKLQECDPVLAVALHPSRLEYLAWYSLAGVVLFVAAMPGLICALAITAYRRIRGRVARVGPGRK